eukprot:2648148-Pyramimonas_sp.AAC.1
MRRSPASPQGCRPTCRRASGAAPASGSAAPCAPDPLAARETGPPRGGPLSSSPPNRFRALFFARPERPGVRACMWVSI